MTNIRSIMDLLDIINEMYGRVDGKIEFDEDGWPVFRKEHFLSEWPGDVVTYDNRNSTIVAPSTDTLICFFAGDKQNYRRFVKLSSDIDVYRMYKGVVVPDITVTGDMDIEMQDTIMLANQLFAAVLAANDIKIVWNTRSGSNRPDHCFRNVPRNVMCASGFLGCRTNEALATMYVNKLLGLLPDKLVIYGKNDALVNKQLDALGVSYRYYDDFHRRSKRRAA